ncbi:MAG: hypothetical protein ACTHZ5_11750 [Micrococcaceae bacterium]
MNEPVQRITLDVPVTPTGTIQSPELMKRYSQILQALDIPARHDFTRVRYGDMSEADGRLVSQVMDLINARYPDVYADPAWDDYIPLEDRPFRHPDDK